MICTLTPGKDACKGDSGSSLDWLDPKSQKYSAIGVVSFGDGCAKDDKPGVYARVSRYIKWIKKTTGATFCKP
ncbi:unnamed protein product [Allacma fusca]|uniref:Peptidase S1 domain-containing protein n=1 Tax=Allacma fusca TaxID=39272 RepID=A0A8J2P4C7_9HEXA|nr:unnamed protein product [Allacma fusca]